VALVARLRGSGIRVSTGEELDAVQALARLGVTSRPQVRAALAACLVKSAAARAPFDHAFDALFPALRPVAKPFPHSSNSAGQGGPASADDPVSALVRALNDGDDQALDGLLADAVNRFAGVEGRRSLDHHTQRTLRRINLAEIYRRMLTTHETSDTSRGALERNADTAAAAEAVEALRRRLAALIADRLGGVGPEPAADQSSGELMDVTLLRARVEQLPRLRAAVRPLARKLASRMGARRRHGRGALDMRRTIRVSLQTGGVPVTPKLRRRRPTRPDLVVLLDVSGSTAMFAPFTLGLLQAVHDEFSRVRSFVFVDGVAEVTEVLATARGAIDPRQLLDRRGLVAHDGRSDYTRALATFLDRWPDAVTARTSVLLVGDARSHDRPPALTQVAELAHRSRRLYWLNPEPRHEWNDGDSHIGAYAMRCTQVFEVSTLRQLADAVAAIG
jgi:uncharacterized protein with von Willebrand factor type A (vWA) domain